MKYIKTVFLLVIISVLLPIGLAQTTPDQCSSFSTCSFCIASPYCGWCKDSSDANATQGQCLSGDIKGPYTDTCQVKWITMMNEHDCPATPQTATITTTTVKGIAITSKNNPTTTSTTYKSLSNNAGCKNCVSKWIYIIIGIIAVIVVIFLLTKIKIQKQTPPQQQEQQEAQNYFVRKF